MAEIGRINRLPIKRLRDYGAHLNGGALGDILLKHKDVPAGCQPGDEVEVFVYQDSEARLRATTAKPHATVGEFARLRVVANAPAGAYLDWGLQKDLLVPKSEQQERMEEGKSYIVHVFLDQVRNRIAASTKLVKFLDVEPSNYKEGQEVDLLIYEKTERGYRAIVNHRHAGMLYANEVFQRLAIGQRLRGYIKKIREDRKLDLCLQKPGLQGVHDISQVILDKVREFGGALAVTDKSRPEDIYALFGVSKKVFKKAVGGLYKKKLITMDAKGIRLAGR